MSVVRGQVLFPPGHTFLSKILTFSNGCILLTIRSAYTKLRKFVNLGVLFQKMYIHSGASSREARQRSTMGKKNW